MKNEENAGPRPSELQQSEQPRSLLVLKSERPLSQEQAKMMGDYLSVVGKKINSQVLIADAGMDVQWQHDLSPLIAAIAAQTEAITRLAASNEALVEAMGQDDPDMVELPVRTYMDGSPVR